MADGNEISISSLPTKTILLDGDMVVIDDGAQSYKMYYSQFKSLFLTAFKNLFVDAAGDTMTGALNMGGNKVTNVAAGESADDAVTKQQLDDSAALKVAKAGDSMTGALVMNDVKVYHRAGGTNYPVLDTRDKVTVTRGVSPNYAAAFTISSPYKATVPGWAMLRSGSGDWQNVSWIVNGTTFLSTGRKSYNTATCLTAFLDAGDTASFNASGGVAYFVPCKQL